jgi:hypothetical protein
VQGGELMKPRVIAAAAIVIATSVIVAIRWTAREPRPSPPAASSDIGQVDRGPLDGAVSPRPARRPGVAPSTAPEVTATRRFALRDVAVAAPEESPAAFQLRVTMSDKIVAFEREANLDEATAQQFRTIFASLQEDYHRLEQVNRTQSREARESGAPLDDARALSREALAQVNDEAVAQLRTILDERQLELLDRSFGLGTLYTAVVARPFEIADESTVRP